MTQNVKIYKINQEHYKLAGIQSRESVIEKVIQLARKKLKTKDGFVIADIPKMEKDSITYYLYVHNFSEKESEWISFFPKELTSSLQFEILNISILLFIDNGRDIFIVIGGNGFQLVIPYIDHTFGLSVLSRVLKPSEDLISSINTRGLTGNRSGLSEQFRNEFRIIDYTRFGKVPVETHVTLSQDISNIHFGFLQSKKNERIKVYAGKSFKLKKNIDFEELHKIVKELGYILELEISDFLSTYIEIKDQKKIEENLNPLLLGEIFRDLENIRNYASNVGSKYPKEKRFKFDFSHPEKLAKFYEADYYVLRERVDEGKYVEFKQVNDKEEIYEAVLERVIEKGFHLDYYKFRGYIQGVRVLSYSDKKNSTSASFLFHFTSEFMFDKKPMFLVDNRWYELKKSFVTDLEFQCVEIIKAYKLPNHILHLPWDKSLITTEGQYNLGYDNKKNYIVLDTFTPDGVELCDILYIEDTQIFLIHVKYGFDSSLRELTNQVTLAARRLYEDKKSNSHTYLNKIYKQIEARRDSIQYSQDEFIELFNRRIIFVFAFASQLGNDYLVEENIEKYTSNIARYSLIQCSQDMQTYMYDLRICQIKRK